MDLLPLFALPAITARRSPLPRWRPFPRYLPQALTIFGSQNNLPATWAADTVSIMQDCADAIKETYDSMSPDQRQEIQQMIVSQGGLSLLPGVKFPSFGEVRTPFPLPTAPLSPVTFPPFPSIPIPPIPNVDAASVTNKIVDKLTGLAGGVVETVKEILTQLPLELLRVIDKFADRVQAAGELLKSGKLDQGIGRLCQAAVLLARDLVAVALATILNLLVDAVAGVIGGLFLSRALTSAEQDFGNSIFHARINLTFVRVAIVHGSTGLTAANVVYVPSLDLAAPTDRSVFAHELTHVYQDQSTFDPATLHAADEFLNHYLGSGRDPYSVTLSSQSSWSQLGVEQQARVVENWQSHVDKVNQLAGAFDNVPSSEVPFYRAILSAEGLF